jgi:hypothetical protein
MTGIGDSIATLTDDWQVLEQHGEIYQTLKALRGAISLNRTGPYRRWARAYRDSRSRLAEVILPDETSA